MSSCLAWDKEAKDSETVKCLTVDCLFVLFCFLLLKIGVLILCPLMCINFIAIEIKGEEFIRVVVKRDLTIIFKN